MNNSQREHLALMAENFVQWELILLKFIHDMKEKNITQDKFFQIEISFLGELPVRQRRDNV